MPYAETNLPIFRNDAKILLASEETEAARKDLYRKIGKAKKHLLCQ
jgi:hypothetical protein